MAKKLTALILALCMIAGLAACTNGNAAGTWEDELGTKGKLRVGMAADYPPYESYDASGNVVSETATWSVEAMVKEAVEGNTSTAEMKALLYAMLTYGDSAADYLGN